MTLDLILWALFAGWWWTGHRARLTKVRRVQHLHRPVDGGYCRACLQPHPCDTTLLLEARR